MGKFSIGDVLSNTFRTYGQTFVPLSVFFAGCMVIPFILGTVAMTPIILWVSTMGSAGGIIVTALAGFALVLFILVIVVVGFLGVIHGAVLSMDGQRPTIGSCLSAGLNSVVRGILAYLIALIALAIAFVPIFLAIYSGAGGFSFVLVLAFYVGMGIAACVYFPIGAVIVKESRGVFGSFSRAADLTRGNRWRIFGMLLVWFVISLIGMSLVFAVLYILGVSPEQMATSQFEFDGIGGILGFIIYVLFVLAIYALSSINVGVLYVRLRDIVDGISPNAAARVFE